MHATQACTSGSIPALASGFTVYSTSEASRWFGFLLRQREHRARTASDQVVNAAGGESMWPSIPPQLWGESIRGLDPQWRPHLLPDPLLQNACGSMVLFSASAFLQISRYLRCFPSSFHPSNVYEPWRFFVRTSDGNNRGHECALANTVPGATT